MDLLQVFDAGERRKSNRKNNEADDEAGNGSGHTNIEHHFVRRDLGSRANDRAKRTEICVGILIPRKGNVERQRRIDAMNPRRNEMPELVRREEEHDERRIGKAERKICKVSNIGNAAPLLTGDGRREIRRKKKEDMKPEPLLSEQTIEQVPHRPLLRCSFRIHGRPSVNLWCSVSCQHPFLPRRRHNNSKVGDLTRSFRLSSAPLEALQQWKLKLGHRRSKQINSSYSRLFQDYSCRIFWVH